MPGLPWLVLPTFNEAENLERIVAAASDVLAAASPDGFRILIVDDGSPDGTGAIADRLADERSDVRVLHRTTREGLGPAFASPAEDVAGIPRGAVRPRIAKPAAGHVVGRRLGARCHGGPR